MSGAELRERLVAILAADAAGYSRLMAADERVTVAALDAVRTVFRTQIEANQGRIIDMAGDSALAVFETAAGAVSAALAVQKALAEESVGVANQSSMRFRIGVHLGDVIEKTDGTVYGDGVNIAARRGRRCPKALIRHLVRRACSRSQDRSWRQAPFIEPKHAATTRNSRHKGEGISYPWW